MPYASWEEMLSSFLICALSIVPYAAGCYIPYWNRLRMGKVKLLLILMAVFVVESIVLALPSDGWDDQLFLFICALDLMIYLLTVKENGWRLCFIFLTFMQLAAVIRSIYIFIANTYQLDFSQENDFILSQSDYNATSIFLTELLVASVGMMAVGFVIKKYMVPLMDKVSDKQTRILPVIPLLFLAIIVIITLFMGEKMGSVIYLTLVLATAACDVVIYFVIFLMFKGMADSVALREENIAYKYREQYYTMLSLHMEESRKQRHDFRHHMRVLYGFLQKQDYAEMSKYLAEYENVADEPHDIRYCENYVVNMVLYYFADIAKKNEIEFTSGVVFPGDSFVKNVDICALISNIIENAVESCERQEGPARWVRINIKSGANEVVIAIDNSCESVNQDVNGEFLSTKTGQIGTGLASICSIAKKYGGNAWFEHSGNRFQTSVVLYRI